MDKRLEIDANNISRTVEALLDEIKEFDDKEDGYKQDIADLEYEIRNLKDEISDLKEEIETLESKLDNVQ